MKLTYWRNRLPNGSPDKPTDKSAKLGPCVKCNENVSENRVVCSQWEHEACAGIKNEEAALLDSVPNNMLCFCSSCIENILDALEYFQVHSAFF